MPAAVVGTPCACAGPPDAIARGSATVFIGGRPAARMGDPTVHGGLVAAGAATVLIGDGGGGGAGTPQAAALSAARQAAAPFAAARAAADLTAWTEIELVDEDGLPVPGEPFVLTPAGGAPVQGTLDANGRARVDGLPQGSCQVSFPRLDAAAWTAR
jgi:hypothetical protein